MDISQIANPVAQNASGGAPSQAAASQSAGSTVAVQASQTEQSDRPDPQAVQNAVEKINRVVESIPSNLEFSTDSDTGIDVVKVVDKGTGEVIRQLPSKEVIAIAKTFDGAQGLVLRDSV